MAEFLLEDFLRWDQLCDFFVSIKGTRATSQRLFCQREIEIERMLLFA